LAYPENRVEHRWGDRIPVSVPVHVTAPAVAGIDACLENLSLSGALINAGCDLRLHMVIEVHIALPATSQRTDGVVKAYVSRKLARGMGIEWCQFAPTIVKTLLRSASVRESAHSAVPAGAPSRR
jgi:hypothetical protein